MSPISDTQSQLAGPERGFSAPLVASFAGGFSGAPELIQEVSLSEAISDVAGSDPASFRSTRTHGSGVAISLLSHVRNAVPYIFETEFQDLAPGLRLDYLKPLWSLAYPVELSDLEFFDLCLRAHWVTLGSSGPTDVEHLIRFRLWQSGLLQSELDEMAEHVLDSYTWATGPLSQRRVKSAISGDSISAHQGEWFAVAAAAYAATRRRNAARAAELLERIQFEVTRQAKVYLEIKRSRDGVGLLKAAALISQNLVELDRVIEGWGLTADVADPLVEFVYRAGHESGSRALRFSGALAEAGRLYRAFMITENHRHFLLRTPKSLRRSPHLLLPVAPFFDAWGESVAKANELSPAELVEIVDALISGWEKLKGPEGKLITHAYPRAIAGLIHAYPGGLDALSQILPPQLDKKLRTGLFRSLVSVPRARFEEQWAQMALNTLK